MRADLDIKRDVEKELDWDPDLVSLTGFVRIYSQKYAAEGAAKRVAGVTGIANDIEVRLPNADKRPDPEIARAAVAAIRDQVLNAAEGIRVVVEDGAVALEGSVEWNYQREFAASAVRRIKGVTGVSNLILVTPRVPAAEVKRKIEEAFRRSAEVDANAITVEATGGEVVLRGIVRSWVEREEAERVAWAAPGVTKVDNRIVLRP